MHEYESSDADLHMTIDNFKSVGEDLARLWKYYYDENYISVLDQMAQQFASKKMMDIQMAQVRTIIMNSLV